MSGSFEYGDLVATTRDLANRNRPGAKLPAGTYGLVIDAGASYVRVEINDWKSKCIRVRPDALEIVEKGFLTDHAAVARSANLVDLWDIMVAQAREVHRLRSALASLVDDTRAEPRLARPGLNGS